MYTVYELKKQKNTLIANILIATCIAKTSYIQ